MPQYLYKHPTEEKYVEVIQRMTEKHVFFDVDGLEWARVFTIPQAIISSTSEMDPFKISDHVRKTGNMKGTIGDLWDIGREMSERREDKLGHEDPVKRKYFDDYKKKNGCKHYHDTVKKIETKHATIEFDD